MTYTLKRIGFLSAVKIAAIVSAAAAVLPILLLIALNAVFNLIPVDIPLDVLAPVLARIALCAAIAGAISTALTVSIYNVCAPIVAGIGYGFIDYQREGDAIRLLLHDRSNSKQKIFDNCLGGYAKDPSVYPVPGATGPKAVKAMDVNTERPAYYETIMAQEWFQRGIERLLQVMAEDEQVATLCSCRDWRDCHRENLIASYLRREEPAPSIRHISFEGELQS